MHLRPDGDENRGVTGLADEAVDASIGECERLTGEGRLIVTLAEEVRIDKRRQERIAECDSSQENTNENQEFGVGNDAHGSIVVGCQTCQK